MMLTNKRNLILGSLIVLPLSIPVIIFAVSAINSNQELFTAQIYILLSILLAAIALGPWIISVFEVSVESVSEHWFILESIFEKYNDLQLEICNENGILIYKKVLKYPDFMYNGK